ncbi:MAG: RsmD family RNA methyltransferase [Deltaproteobacteria bacterium]|nr:RsmD family RNA methyltransferase [Deltaproteobacteria bacterium]
MRIIAGTAKRCRLDAPVGLHTRPTSDLVRGAACSQLGGFWSGGRVLDLCAGTGAVALELLSRGADRAVAVENDAAALACLRANAARARLADRLDIRAQDLGSALRDLTGEGQVFDVVWLDPPWSAGLEAEALDALGRGGLVKPGGDLFVQSAAPLVPGLYCEWFAVVDVRRHGAGHLSRLEPSEHR